VIFHNKFVFCGEFQEENYQNYSGTLLTYMEEYNVQSTSRMLPGECTIIKIPTKICPHTADKAVTCSYVSHNTIIQGKYRRDISVGVTLKNHLVLVLMTWIILHMLITGKRGETFRFKSYVN
jgi:ABC-type transporter MlaC component